MKFQTYVPIVFLILAIAPILLPKDIFTAVLIFLMVLSGVVTIFTNIDIFNDDERDK